MDQNEAEDKVKETFPGAQEAPAQPVATSAPDSGPSADDSGNLAADGDEVVGGVDEKDKYQE